MDTNATAKSPFIIRNGLLVSLGKPGGHLISNDEYENYRLRVEYRFAGVPAIVAFWFMLPLQELSIKCSQNPLKYKWRIKMPVISGASRKILIP